MTNQKSRYCRNCKYGGDWMPCRNESPEPCNNHSLWEPYFGKGCQYFSGQWDRDDINHIGKPLINSCNHPDNEDKFEGGCHPSKCPFSSESLCNPEVDLGKILTDQISHEVLESFAKENLALRHMLRYVYPRYKHVLYQWMYENESEQKDLAADLESIMWQLSVESGGYRFPSESDFKYEKELIDSIFKGSPYTLSESDYERIMGCKKVEKK
jgi:hypothetical protein